MDGIKINFLEVKEYSNRLKVLNSEILDNLILIQKEMDSLSAIWQSSSCEAIISRFKLFARKFQDLNFNIENYARFLDLASQSYESNESTITSNANSFE